MFMPRGGARVGAGRPKRYGCETKQVRLPVTAIKSVMQFIEDKQNLKLPLFSSKVPAGFPSPADDHVEEHLDLNDLIKHPAATFLVRVSGHSMKDAGIHENDILIVDRSLLPTQDKVVVAAVDGQLTVKRINKKNGKLFLMPANLKFSPIEIKEENDIHIWGVVTKVIHDM
jgi:DNA polymerase V